MSLPYSEACDFRPQAARFAGRGKPLVACARHAEREDSGDALDTDPSPAPGLVRAELIVAGQTPGSHDGQRPAKAVADEEDAFRNTLERRDQGGPDAFNSIGEAAVDAVAVGANVEIRDPVGRHHRIGAREGNNDRRLALGDEPLGTALAQPRAAGKAPAAQNALQFWRAALLATVRGGFVSRLRHPHERLCQLDVERVPPDRLGQAIHRIHIFGECGQEAHHPMPRPRLIASSPGALAAAVP